MSEKHFLKRIRDWYSRASWARAILTTLPYSTGIHEFLIIKTNDNSINHVRCEMAISRFINELTDGSQKIFYTFKIWADEAELRRVLCGFLMYYDSQNYTVDLPLGLEHHHSDETGNEILDENTLRDIWCILSHRGFLWEDPYNDHKILTPSGKELMEYLKKY